MFLFDVFFGALILLLSRKAFLSKYENEPATRAALFDCVGFFIGIVILCSGVVGFIRWL